MRVRRVLTTSVLVCLFALGTVAMASGDQQFQATASPVAHSESSPKAKPAPQPQPRLSREDLLERIDMQLGKAHSLLALADRLVTQGRHDEAIDVLNRVVAMELPAEREADKLVTTAYLNLGNIYSEPSRSPSKAIVFYGSAIERMTIDEDYVLMADTLGRVSGLYLAEGNATASAQVEAKLLDMQLGNLPADFGLVPADNGLTTRDAGDDTCDMSVAVAIPHEEQMSINPAFDENWRDFALTEPRIVTIATLDADTGKDTKLELWDDCAAGGPIDADDDGGPGLLSLIETECLDPGDYFVNVFAFSDRTPQDFTLSITDAPCPIPPTVDEYEPDDEPGLATKIGFRNNGNGQGQQLGRDNKQIQRHSFFPSPDLDYVFFGLSRPNWVNIETLGVDGENPDTVMGLSNSGGTLLAVNDDKGSGAATSQLRFCLPDGDWFVPILPFFGTDEFEYDILVDVEGSCLFETEPNGQCFLANEITIDEIWNGIHAPAGLTFEEDWFSFTIDESGLVTIETDGYDEFDVDTYLELYNACGGSLLAADDDGGPGFLSKISAVLDAGTYYVMNRLSPIAFTTGTTWPYSLTVSLSEAPLAEVEPNDACGEGNAAALGDSILASINPVGDRDSFILTVPSEGLIEIETNGGSGDTVLNIADSDGTTQIGCDDDDGDSLFSKWSCCLPAGDYCVTVKEWGDNASISSYTIDFRDLGTCTPSEPLVCDIHSTSQCNPF